MNRVFSLLLPLLLAVGSHQLNAQQLAVKTNLLYDATATVNLGIEAALAPQWTLDLSGNYNAWEVASDRLWKHFLVQPEVRYWLCDRFSGHFFGLHLHGGKYNLANIDNNIHFLGTDFSVLSDYRFQGWFIGAGVGYGYDFIIGRHWNLELELGIGYAYTEYDKFVWQKCGRQLADDMAHHYFGITKLAVGFTYLF